MKVSGASKPKHVQTDRHCRVFISFNRGEGSDCVMAYVYQLFGVNTASILRVCAYIVTYMCVLILDGVWIG
jgi:hypothetical protein